MNLPCGNGASSQVGREEAFRWNGRKFPVGRPGRRLPGEKGGSFMVERQAASSEEGESYPVEKNEASRLKVMKLPGGKGESFSVGSFLVGRELSSRWEGMKLPGGNL